MKNKIGIIAGFLAGSIGFLFLFKVLILDRTSPEDELAPGMVVMLAILTGTGCLLMVNWLQKFFRRENER